MVTLQSHANYNPDDAAYLRAKGWTDEQILRRWDEEQRRGLGPCRWSTPPARAKLRAVTGH